MPTIRKRTAACAVAALLCQIALVPLATAEDFMTAYDQQPRLMLYVSKAFGEKKNLHTAPQLGLRFERSVETGRFRQDLNPVTPRTMSLVDLRWTKGFGRSVHLLDVPVYRSPLQLNSSEDSAGSSADESLSGESLPGESMSPRGRVILWSAAIVGVFCVSRTLICEKTKNGYVRPQDIGPLPGE